jgi:capsid protein
MGTTYEAVMSDFGDMSFSASRVQLMEHDSINKEWQRLLVQRVLQRIYRVWVSKRMTAKLLPFNAQAFDKYKWIGPASESVDPVGDASAQLELMNAKVMSKQRYYTQLGLDWQSEMAQVKREEEYAAQIGMAGVNPGSEPVVDDAEQVEQDNEKDKEHEAIKD